MEKYLYEDLYTLEEKHWWHISKRNMVSSLISKYITNKNPQILDIGCGTGKNVEMLSRIGTAWGLDNSVDAIEFCRKRGLKNIKLGQSSKTGFENSSFDAVTLLDVLEHVDEDPTLKEIRRILRDNQFLIITVPAFSWLWSKWDQVLHHKRRYTKQSLRKVLERNNFKIEKISYMYSFLVLPALLIRFIKSLFFKDYYPSDFKLSSPSVNNLLIRISNIERFFIENANIPFGTSLVCIAKK